MLTEQEILYIWEIGQDQHLVDRALTMLAIAFPELPPEKLPSLSIGQRDAYLLTAHECNFGRQLASLVTCPACQESLEFVLDTVDIRVSQNDEFADLEQEMTIEGIELRFRLPTSQDLALITECHDSATARNQLVKRCILQARQGDRDLTGDALPEVALAAIAAQMAKSDPQADIQLALTCPECGHSWSVTFDLVVFFWAEICSQAKRLLRDVHILAQAYSWREEDILSMSARRRQFYLEMVT